MSTKFIAAISGLPGIAKHVIRDIVAMLSSPCSTQQLCGLALYEVQE